MKRVDSRPKVHDSIEQLEKGLLIDEHALNDALVAQPELFYRVSKQLTTLVSERDAQKQTVGEVEAKADMDIRETALRHKDKTTEAEIKNMIRMDEDVQRASRLLLTLNRKVGELEALKGAFQQRSYVLKDLVNLYIANYYSDSTEGSSQRSMRDHGADRARDALRNRRREYSVGGDRD